MKRFFIGGSFSPITHGHLFFSQQIADEFPNSQIYFQPVGDYYKKAGLFPAEDRYNMLKLVCDKNDNFSVLRTEIDREKQLTTIEMMREMKKEFPKDELFFVTGTDNVKQMHRWYSWEELLQEFTILVIERDEDDLDEILSSHKNLNEFKDSFIRIKSGIKTNYSSTLIRETIKKGKSIRYLVPDEIQEYIEKNDLKSFLLENESKFSSTEKTDEELFKEKKNGYYGETEPYFKKGDFKVRKVVNRGNYDRNGPTLKDLEKDKNISGSSMNSPTMKY